MQWEPRCRSRRRVVPHRSQHAMSLSNAIHEATKQSQIEGATCLRNGPQRRPYKAQRLKMPYV